MDEVLGRLERREAMDSPLMGMSQGPLLFAVTLGDVALTKRILSEGVKVDVNASTAVDGLTALHTACLNATCGDEEAVEVSVLPRRNAVGACDRHVVLP
jgi:hypothetical protein